MYLETSGTIYGQNVYVSFDRTDIIHISSFTFYYNGFSAGSTKSMGRFQIQLLLRNSQWFSKYKIDKNTHYNRSSIDWNPLHIGFTEPNFSVELVYDEIRFSFSSDMCFVNIIITHSVF